MIAKETTVTFFVEAHHSMHARGTMSTKDVKIELSCSVNRRDKLLHRTCSLMNKPKFRLFVIWYIHHCIFSPREWGKIWFFGILIPYIFLQVHEKLKKKLTINIIHTVSKSRSPLLGQHRCSPNGHYLILSTWKYLPTVCS